MCSISMAYLWHGTSSSEHHGGEQLLASARQARQGLADAALIDEALAALLARNRAAELDAVYSAYEEHPLDEADEWGDLASWRRAAGAS